MALPKNPRQAMINIMYLVLTAMLALNISAEVLNAFIKVDESIQKSTVAVDSSSSLSMKALVLRADNDVEAKPYLERAVRARLVADSLVQDIEILKEELKHESGVKTAANGEKVLRNGRDTHTPTYWLINKGKGAELKAKIKDARQKFLSFYDVKHVDAEGKSLPLRAVDPEPTDDVIKTWEEDLFEEMPVVAALAMLSKLQNDVRTSEAQVIQYLLDEAGMIGFDFDQVMAQAIPRARWVTIGDQMKIELMVSAYDSKVKSEILIGPLDMSQVAVAADGRLTVKDKHQEHPPLIRIDEHIETGEGGIAQWARSATVAGNHELSGVIKVVDQDNGQVSWFPFRTEYQAIRPAAVVSPDYMNVLYIGVDNPMSVSVPGFTDDKVSASISSGTLTRNGSGYIARVTEPGSVYVNVFAQTETGVKPMGRAEFKVKRLPDPDYAMGPYKGGCITRASLQAMTGITAQAPWFYFPVNYRVAGYSVSLGRGGQVFGPYAVNGALFPDQVKELFRTARVGDRIWIDDIIAIPPDDSRRKGDLSFKICS